MEQNSSFAFKGIIGHESIVSGGSRFTVYTLEVAVQGKTWFVKHRYQDFKELYDKVCP